MTASFHMLEQHTPASTPALRLGIPSCLLGAKVRYDGGHKHDAFLVETLGRFFQWVPVCPETEMGLGTPRESLCLVGRAEAPRMLTTRTQHDITEAMQSYAISRMDELQQQHFRRHPVSWVLEQTYRRPYPAELMLRNHV